MTERTRRLWAGVEADAIGHGGVAAVAAATCMAISTVRKGRSEVRAGSVKDVVRDRRPGAGRKRLEEKDPAITAALEALVDPVTRGDPESPLRWTSKSTRALAQELTRQGHPVGANKVAELLRKAGYSLQGTSRMKEGRSHPDRNAQFEHINARSKEFISRNVPVISVDTKKKEAVGEYANRGREWQPKGKAVEVLTYDWCDSSTPPKAIPYGVYDVAQNNAYVNVGTDHDTPVFAVHSIGRWWTLMGSLRYPNAKELFITADSGGSNSRKSNVWKAELQEMADRSCLTIHVSHFPPGTSKWNKIEHRLFSFISLNWRGRPLTTYQTVVSLIAGTTTQRGLRVSSELDEAKYPLGIRLQRHVLRGLNLERNAFHGEWNYTLCPRTSEQLEAIACGIQTASDPISHAERRARWMQLIKEQLQSGVSNKEFCRRRKINFDTFIQARRRILGRIRPRSKNDR